MQYSFNIDLSRYHEKLMDSKLMKISIANADRIIEDSRNNNIEILTINDSRYPSNLKSIETPPAILYIKGDISSIDLDKSIGIIGTREPSISGKDITNMLATSLVKEEFTIVSGLAKGIDSESHKSAIFAGGKTVAVLAHGLDMVYPKENEYLAQDIIEHQGLLISEYPIGTKVQKSSFINRNRIISGISKAIISVEARENSGSMHTIKYALNQNKKIFYPLIRKEDNEIFSHTGAIELKSKNDYKKVIESLGYETIDSKLKNLIYNIGLDKSTIDKFMCILENNNISISRYLEILIKDTVDKN